MRPTAVSQGGMPTGHKWMGWWGAMGSAPQKGITQYTISHFQAKPMQGALRQYLWGGYTRILHQIPYFIVPFAALYGIISWSTERNHYVNSKAGIKEAEAKENLQ